MNRKDYKTFDRWDYDSETLAHFEDLGVVMQSPWDKDVFIAYIGKGKPSWNKLLRQERKCPATSTMPAVVDEEALIRKNLKVIKKMAKHLEPQSGLTIKRNTIILAIKKNRRLCKDGISGYHIAHHHSTTPGRICIRRMFLINPSIPSRVKCAKCGGHHIRYMMTYERSWFRLGPNGTSKCQLNLPARHSELIILADLISHELGHEGTNGHGIDFQKKYMQMFRALLSAIISGGYYGGSY